MAEIATTKLYENERMILWEFVLEPGARTETHTHRYDYVFYVLEGSRLEVLDAGDRALFAFDASAGDVFSLRCDGAELVSTADPSFRAPATHAARNLGSGRYREILVETKR